MGRQIWCKSFRLAECFKTPAWIGNHCFPRVSGFPCRPILWVVYPMAVRTLTGWWSAERRKPRTPRATDRPGSRRWTETCKAWKGPAGVEKIKNWAREGQPGWSCQTGASTNRRVYIQTASKTEATLMAYLTTPEALSRRASPISWWKLTIICRRVDPARSPWRRTCRLSASCRAGFQPWT